MERATISSTHGQTHAGHEATDCDFKAVFEAGYGLGAIINPHYHRVVLCEGAACQHHDGHKHRDCYAAYCRAFIVGQFDYHPETLTPPG